jgi:hypothetical protein
MTHNGDDDVRVLGDVRGGADGGGGRGCEHDRVRTATSDGVSYGISDGADGRADVSVHTLEREEGWE